jgi:hypothetical protein
MMGNNGLRLSNQNGRHDGESYTYTDYDNVPCKPMTSAIGLWCRSMCWVLEVRWLPFNTMLAPMAASLAAAGASKSVAVGAQREQIKSAVPAPENVRGFRFKPEQLRDVSPRLRSLCRATICLIDSHTNQRISLAPPPSTWRNFGMSRASRWKPCSPAT